MPTVLQVSLLCLFMALVYDAVFHFDTGKTSINT
jgi:hypothetical protein